MVYVFVSLSAPSNLDSKIPVAVADNEFALGSAELSLVSVPVIDTVLVSPLSREKDGFSRSDKSKIPLPPDSIELSIPSLSLSRSMLSIIPSLSKSFGQMLSLTSEDW